MSIPKPAVAPPLAHPIASRRGLLLALAGGAMIAACSENSATGRRQLMVVSDEMLASMSASAWEDLKAKTPIWSDAAAQDRLRRIGERIADATGLSGQSWEFIAFDSPEVNAFVLPGGRVGFFRGLLDLAQSDDEIAAVMGHEGGHVTARHAAERMSQQMAVQAGVALAQIALQGEFGENADEIAGVLGMGALYGVILPYSRQHEFEADRLGVSLMAKAGYDPQGAADFWRRMAADSAGGPQPLALLSTHPANDERLAVLEAEIAKL
jgi:predicted Zn-dependent protease